MALGSNCSEKLTAVKLLLKQQLEPAYEDLEGKQRVRCSRCGFLDSHSVTCLVKLIEEVVK